MESIDSKNNCSASFPLSQRRLILALSCLVIFLGVGIGGEIGNWLPIPRAAALVPLALSLLLFYRQRAAWERTRRLARITTPFLLLVLWAVLSAVNSEEIVRSSALYLAGGVVIAFIFALSMSIRTDSDLRFFTFSVLATAFLVCARGIYEFSVTGEEVISGLVSPNHLAGFILIVLPSAALNFGGERNPAAKLFLGGAVAAMTVCLFLTFSRGGMAGFLAQAAALAVMRKKKILLFLAALVLLAFILVPYELPNLVSTLWDRSYSTNVQRLELWGASLRMIWERPVLGFGPGVFPRFYPRYLAAPLPREIPAPCNVYLHVAVMGGLPGLFVMLWLVIVLLRQSIAWQAARELSGYKRVFAGGVFLSAVGILTQGLFDF